MKTTERLLQLAAAGLACALLVGACGGQSGGGGATAPAGVTPIASTPTKIPPAATTEAQATSASRPAVAFEWSAEIVQNGAALITEAGEVKLARAPFTLRVRMPQPVPVKLNAFNTDQNFKALETGYVFTADCQLALCTGMDVAEERLNPAQDLFVDVELTHYLYYATADDNRWSRVTVDDSGAVLERDVATLNASPIEQNADPALYLLLFADPTNPGQIDPGELIKLVLKFQ